MVYAAGAGAGWLASSAGVPLPWMIGPIISTAVLYLAEIARVPIPTWTRIPGQVTVAAQVGIAFTPAALAAVIGHAGLLLGMAWLTVVWAFICAALLMRLSGQGYVASFLATVPTSPVEAAVIAERLGQPPGIIAVAQTLRIAAVVIIVPLSVYAIDGWPDRSVRPGGIAPFQPLGTLALLSFCVLVSRVFGLLNLSNPWFMGSLAASAALAAMGIEMPLHPPLLLAAAQILMGAWLGSTFTRAIFARAGRTTFAILFSGMAFLCLCAGSAIVLARTLGMQWEELLLGAAPGGVTEMALTAEFMRLDLALVTAFHLTRVFTVMPMVPVMAGWLHRRLPG